MTTPSKRSKRLPRASGASESPPQPEAAAVEPEEVAGAVDAPEAPAEDSADSEDQVAMQAEPPEEAATKPRMEVAKPPVEAEEEEPTVLEEGSAEKKTGERRTAPVTQPLSGLPPAHVAEQEEGEAEGEATMIARTPSRPRKTTLAMAITPRPMPAYSDSQTDYQAPRDSAEPAEPRVDAPRDGEAGARRGAEAAGVVADEVDEWSIADQPTVYLSPQLLTRPPRPLPPSVEPPARIPDVVTPRRPPEYDRPPRDRAANPPRWLASTDDDRWPATNHRPSVTPERARPFPPADEHMERLQRLREGRMAHQEGTRAPGEGRQVADIVRQWWRDLRPNLTSALSYQREARASGVHPIPAHEPSPGSRLGDAFGRFAASAREMTGRAQSAMTPRLNRLQELHAQAESKASALVQRMEAPLSRQQAPLLGPGRIAVFFKPGVTVGQAQSLLGASRARPIRLIPRKHGFLALVPPGAEAEICERLREHPYIRDVAYVEYDEYGDPIRPSTPPR